MTESYTPGRFVWHEIATPDIEASKKFYGPLFNWTFNEMPMPDGPYTMIMNGESPQGGVFDLKKMPKENVPPHWMSYVSVPNVDEAVAAAKSGGGMVAMDAMDIPNVGRMAVIGDPQHAYTTAFKSAQGDPPIIDRPPAGNFCWDTLSTTDVEAAKKFYAKVYGLKAADFNGMTTLEANGKGVADIQPVQGGAPPHWLPFVVVDTLERARKTATDNGGKVMVEMIPIPEVGNIAIIADNVGVAIGLFEQV